MATDWEPRRSKIFPPRKPQKGGGSNNPSNPLGYGSALPAQGRTSRPTAPSSVQPWPNNIAGNAFPRADSPSNESHYDYVGEGNDPIEPEWPNAAQATEQMQQETKAKRSILDNPEVQRYLKWIQENYYEFRIVQGFMEPMENTAEINLRTRKKITEYFAAAAQPVDTPRNLRKLSYDQPYPSPAQIKFARFVYFIGIAGTLFFAFHVYHSFNPPANDILRFWYAQIFNYRWAWGSSPVVELIGIFFFIVFLIIWRKSAGRAGRFLKEWDGTPLYGNSIYAHYNDDLTPKDPSFDPLGFMKIKGPLADYYGKSPFGDATTANKGQAHKGMKGKDTDNSPYVRN